MRVSERKRFEAVLDRVETAKDNNLREINKLSSQKNINKISDDPTGYNRSLIHKANINDIKAFKRNLNFAKGFLEVSENALQGIFDNLQ